jgi:hypothetical protein
MRKKLKCHKTEAKVSQETEVNKTRKIIVLRARGPKMRLRGQLKPESKRGEESFWQNKNNMKEI